MNTFDSPLHDLPDLTDEPAPVYLCGSPASGICVHPTYLDCASCPDAYPAPTGHSRT